MSIYLKNNEIIIKNSAGELTSQCLPYVQIDVSNGFVTTDKYNEIYTAISSLGEQESLILSSEYYSIPGFIQGLVLKTGILEFYSDIEVMLECIHYDDGEYTFIEINKDSSSTFLVSIQGDSYSVVEYNTISNKELKKTLINSLKEFLKTNIEAENIFEVIFNYTNVIALNCLLTDTKYGLVGNETAYNDRNLYYSGSAFKTIFTADLVLPDFFKIIANCIETHINVISKNKRTIVQSPLLDYLRVISFIKPSEHLIYVNKLQQFSEFKKIELKIKKSITQVELEIYPSKSKTNLPFSSWILTETNNLLLNFKLNQKNYEIDLSPLKNEFTNTIFSLGNKSIFKYFVFIDENSCGNLHLKLKGLNGVEYFKTINR